MEAINKYKALRVPAKASIWYIASSGIARAVGALCTPIFTRLLTPTEYGLYPLYASWLGILSVLVTLEMSGSIIYRGYQRFEGRREDFTSAAIGVISTVFIGFCALYFAFHGFIENFTGLGTRVSIFMFLEIYGAAIISLYLAKAKFEYKYKAVTLLNILSSVLIPFSAIILILSTGIRAEARIYTSAIITLAIAVTIIATTVKRVDKLYSAEMWRYLLGRSIPLLPHYLSASLILKAGEISIGRSHGTAALGQYSIAVSVGMILTVVTGGLLSALVPWIMRKIREGGIDRVREMLLLITRALALISLLVLAAAPEVLSLLAAEGFRDALPAVYPIEIAALLSFLSGTIMSACTYYERGGLSSLASVLAAAVSIALAFLVLPRVDYRFAGVFALISYLVMAVISSFIFKRLSGEFPIDVRKSAVILTLSATYGGVLFVLRGVMLSRIFLALPLLALLLMSAKELYVKIKE